MDHLNLKTAGELVRLHNTMCADDARIEGPWKRSKRNLIERIRAFGGPGTVENRPAAAESAAVDDTETIGAFIAALIVTDLTYDEIVRLVIQRFPDAHTNARSVASIASVFRKRGIKVPFRRAGKF